MRHHLLSRLDKRSKDTVLLGHESRRRVELDNASVAERHDVIRIHDRPNSMLPEMRLFQQDEVKQRVFASKMHNYFDKILKTYVIFTNRF